MHSPPRLAALALTETAAVDTHDLVKRLTGSGMPEPQAEILYRVIARVVAQSRDSEFKVFYGRFWMLRLRAA